MRSVDFVNDAAPVGRILNHTGEPPRPLPFLIRESEKARLTVWALRNSLTGLEDRPDTPVREADDRKWPTPGIEPRCDARPLTGTDRTCRAPMSSNRIMVSRPVASDTSDLRSRRALHSCLRPPLATARNSSSASAPIGSAHRSLPHRSVNARPAPRRRGSLSPLRRSHDGATAGPVQHGRLPQSSAVPSLHRTPERLQDSPHCGPGRGRHSGGLGSRLAMQHPLLRVAVPPESPTRAGFAS